MASARDEPADLRLEGLFRETGTSFSNQKYHVLWLGGNSLRRAPQSALASTSQIHETKSLAPPSQKAGASSLRQGKRVMKEHVREDQYRSLAELRYRIRLFQQQSERAARQMGVEPQQYQLLLAIRGLEPEAKCTIRALSERLLLKHHSTVELVDRMEAKDLVIRMRDRDDRRQVLVRLQPRGEQVLEKIVRKRVEDLRRDGRAFVKALKSLLDREKNSENAAMRPLGRPPSGRTSRGRPSSESSPARRPDTVSAVA
jgi:DNA-binding MarR family transcriptional regulator